MTVPPQVLRVVLEEQIRFGEATRRPAATRACERLPGVSEEIVDAALAETGRAIRAAESLAREYVAGTRKQSEAVDELRRQFPWLEKAGLAERLGQFGFYLAIK